MCKWGSKDDLKGQLRDWEVETNTNTPNGKLKYNREHGMQNKIKSTLVSASGRRILFYFFLFGFYNQFVR